MRTYLDKTAVRIGMARCDIDNFNGLAVAANISPNTIYRALRQDDFRLSTLDAIANALGVPPVSLLRMDEDETERVTA